MIEWTLGLLIPVLVAGPVCEQLFTLESPSAFEPTTDYLVQGIRFEVYESIGCENNPDDSVLGVLLVYSWAVVPPLLSVIIYYRTSSEHGAYAAVADVSAILARVIRTLYQHRRDTHQFVGSNSSMSRNTITASLLSQA